VGNNRNRKHNMNRRNRCCCLDVAFPYVYTYILLMGRTTFLFSCANLLTLWSGSFSMSTTSQQHWMFCYVSCLHSNYSITRHGPSLTQGFGSGRLGIFPTCWQIRISRVHIFARFETWSWPVAFLNMLAPAVDLWRYFNVFWHSTVSDSWRRSVTTAR